MKQILAIGTTNDIKNNRFTGQSAMFDGMVDAARHEGFDVDVIDISRKHGNTKIGRVLDYIGVLTRMVCKCLRYKYCLVYIVSSQSRFGFCRDYCMISICRWFAIKVVTHQYGANYHQLLDVLSSREYKRLQKMTDYISFIIVEGDFMKAQFSFYDGFNDKVIVIPNGLPVEGKHMMTPKTYDGKSTFTLFYLSNLIFSKGYFDVLKALDILVNKEKRDVKCVFAGRFMASDDDERKCVSNRKDFNKYILNHNLSNRVSYFPGLYGEEKDMYFYKSNVFILPTYYINEGQPVSIIEAMAYGCIPVVTEYRHIPMMVNENNGCFVKPQSPYSICEEICKLMDNTDLYAKKSIQAIADYQSNFKFDRYASKVLAVINSVIK